jgi:hypothetical protein
MRAGSLNPDLELQAYVIGFGDWRRQLGQIRTAERLGVAVRIERYSVRHMVVRSRSGIALLFLFGSRLQPSGGIARKARTAV